MKKFTKRAASCAAFILSLALTLTSGILHEENAQTSETPVASVTNGTGWTIISKKNAEKFTYDFMDEMSYGIDMKGSQIDFEGLAGIKITALKNNKFSVMAYRHTDKKFESMDITVYDTKNSKELQSFTLKMTSKDKLSSRKKSVKLVGDGLYQIRTDLGNNIHICGYVYMEDGRIQACRYDGAYDEDSYEKWTELMADADPEDYLDGSDITYPLDGSKGFCNHREAFEKLSDEIITNEEWSDEFKVFALIKYLTENYAFDQWACSQPLPRAWQKGIYNDDSLFAYGNHVGVCWDFTNILNIMCRHHGIPCTSVEFYFEKDGHPDGHTSNAIYLNGRWVNFDLSTITTYVNYNEDPDPSNWHKQPQSWANRYGIYDGEYTSHDHEIWTPEHIEKYQK